MKQPARKDEVSASSFFCAEFLSGSYNRTNDYDGTDDPEELFAALERSLNLHANESGGLFLPVPAAFVEGEKTQLMMSIKAYRTPRQFLEDTEQILEQKEVENNLILGICNDLANKTETAEGCVFINSLEDGKIQATSIKTISKAVVAGSTRDVRHIKNLADYYSDNNIELTGAVGESFYSTKFSKFYGRRQIGEIVLIVHQLTAVNDLPLTTGRFELADVNDVDLIAEWTVGFERDAKAFPVKTKEQALKITRERIALGSLFKWVDKGETVSIAAIVRRTKNLGIVGLVYTPAEARGQGYATSCVQKLSAHILQNGFQFCGLFTDKANPAANHIYKKIGYFPITEFTDIEFEQF